MTLAAIAATSEAIVELAGKLAPPPKVDPQTGTGSAGTGQKDVDVSTGPAGAASVEDAESEEAQIDLGGTEDIVAALKELEVQGTEAKEALQKEEKRNKNKFVPLAKCVAVQATAIVPGAEDPVLVPVKMEEVEVEPEEKLTARAVMAAVAQRGRWADEEAADDNALNEAVKKLEVEELDLDLLQDASDDALQKAAGIAAER